MQIQYIAIPLLFSLLLNFIINLCTFHFKGISSTLLKMNAVHRYKVMLIVKIFDKPHFYENEAYKIKGSKINRKNKVSLN